MKTKKQVPLAQHTSFRTGGKARFFVEAGNVADLRKVVSEAEIAGLPYKILGEGTNVLATDADFDGYIIRPMIRGIDISEDGTVVAGAGEHWDDVVAAAVAKNLAGLETMSGIPGSVGAAPVQNIGAYGSELKDVFVSLDIYDPESGAETVVWPADCQFGYRDSFFKHKAGSKFIITSVTLKLIPGGKPNILYKDLQKYFDGGTDANVESAPTLAEVRDAVLKIRREKLPDPARVGTAGSFFKNPVITAEKCAELSEKFPGLPSFPAKGDRKKIPLAWILDKVCGLNGCREGAVGLYKTQPLALVNYGEATAQEIENFATKIAENVREKTGLEIEWEVNRFP